MSCYAKDCDRAVKQQGLCAMHAQRLWRTGRLDKVKGKYHSINQTKDPRPGCRGYLEANTIDDIRYKAKQRGKTWNLSPEVAFKLITSECLYCGYVPSWPTSRVGIDRVDNSIGYTEDNCVSCCFTCNSAKGEKSVEEFIAWIKLIHLRLIKD
jgi:hypothetical protein